MGNPIVFFETWEKLFALYLLVFLRVVGVFAQAPLFGRPKGIPMPAQVGYALAISYVMFHSLPPPKTLPVNVLETAVGMIAQFLIGLAIGFASYLVPAAVEFAGGLVDYQMGVAIAASFDPAEGGAINLIRQFEFRLAILVWIFIHGDYYLFRAMQRSFEIVPPQSVVITGFAVRKLVEMSGMIFTVALEISAPILIALFITHVMLGLLNRAAPQINVFMLSYPLNILVGMTFLLLSLYPLARNAIPALYDNFNNELASLISSLKYH